MLVFETGTLQWILIGFRSDHRRSVMPRFEKPTVPPPIPEIRPVRLGHPDFVGRRGANGAHAGHRDGASGSCWPALARLA